MLRRLNLSGNPNLGVYISVNDDVAIVPLNLPEAVEKAIKEVLEVDLIPTTITGSNLIGALSVGNKNGFLVSPLTNDTEIDSLKEQGVNVERIDGKFTAIGNILLANDNGAICSSLINENTHNEMEKYLKIDINKTDLAGFKIVGSIAIATNKGVLLNPNVTEEDIQLIEKIFKVPAYIGTVNHGYGLVGACAIANSNGAIVGENTTGPEMARIEQALGFLEEF